MKKNILLILLVMTLVGCGNKVDYKEEMRKYATDYYETYMSGVNGQTVNEVSLKALKDANKYGKEYDLENLKKCDDDSYVNIILTEDAKKIKKYEYHLNCK